nr:integrase, catalytic region, zinc finger, CCHC-type, peptidase aspartic, catalytic [Tanacetum cinerariifolium]
MTTLAEHMIVAGAENCSPMLDKTMYNSWLNQNGQIRNKKYAELIEQEKLQDDCDVQETNVILQGLPPDVYSLVNHCQSAKDIRDRSKFVADVKLAKNMYNTNYDQLYAYLSQHEGHANEVRMLRERYSDPLALVANYQTQLNYAQASFDLRNQATIQDGRVTVQQVQGRQGQRLSGTGTTGNVTSSKGNIVVGQEKMLLVQAEESGQVLDEEQLEFLADTGVATYLQETKNVIVQYINSSAQQDAMIMSVFEQMSNQVSNCDKIDIENKRVNESLTAELERYKNALKQEIDSLKQILSKQVNEKESLDFDFRGSESIKMLSKQNDPISKEKKVNISIIIYNELNKLAEDFGKHFVSQMELFVKQAFWLPLSNPKSEELDVTQTPVKIEVPKELPKISLVKTSFQNLKNHLASFEKVVKVRTTPVAITEGSWVLNIPKRFSKKKSFHINTLRASFKDFENGLHNELNEVKTMFNQMKAAVEQRADSVPVNVLSANNKCLVNDNLKIKRLKQENDHVFELLLSQDIVHICVNSLASRNDYREMQQGFIHEYNENLMLKAELAKKEHMVEKKFFDEVVLRCSRLKNRNKVVEHARALSPLDSDLDYAFTPLNKNKKVRFAEPATSSGNTQKQSCKRKKTWKPIGKVFIDTGYRSKRTGRTFTIVGNTCPLTRITSTKVEPLKESTSRSVTTPNLEIKIYRRKTKVAKSVLRFGNDHIAKIMGHGDYQMGNIAISQVYYVKGLCHNLFFVGQFCDSDLEVDFHKHACYIREFEGVDLLKGLRGSNLYTLSLEDMMLSSPICLLSKASKTKSWLWHRRLSHLNFDSITALAKQGLVRGLPKVKF